MQTERPINDNHKNIGQRLRMEMQKRGLSSVELARRSDVKTSFLYDVISGKSTNPSSVKLARVAESLGVSLTYLAGVSDHPAEGYQFSLPQQLQDYVAIKRLSVERKSLISHDNAQESCHFHKNWLKNNIEANALDLRLLTINGDHMNPTLRHGDIALIDTNRKHPSPPGIFILFDGESLVAKRLELIAHPERPRLRIICDNADYSTFESTPEETAVIGRVVWFSREV